MIVCSRQALSFLPGITPPFYVVIQLVEGSTQTLYKTFRQAQRDKLGKRLLSKIMIPFTWSP